MNEGVVSKETGVGKSRTALLGTRTAPCDAILEDFIIYSQKSKCKQRIKFSMDIFVTYFVQTSSSESS